MSVFRHGLGGHEPFEQSVSPRLAGRVGGGLFLGGAALTAIATQLPLPDSIERGGFWVLSAAQVILGGLMLASSRLDGRAAEYLKGAVALGSVLTVSAAIVLSGVEADGAAVLAVFYVLPAIYAGYFFRLWAIVVVVATITAAYCASSAIVGAAASAVLVRGVVTLSVVAGAAAAVHAVRLHVDDLVERLNRQARVDPLTTLLNRRGFDEQLGAELARQHRSGEPLTLAIGDLDHFKLINDHFGHAVGDRVLREIGRVLGRTIRTVDTVARIGGEEFAVLMPGTDAQSAIWVVNRIRTEIASITDPDGNPIEITFGVASTDDRDCTDAATLLVAADRALYQGKAKGRNSTVFHSQSGERVALPQ